MKRKLLSLALVLSLLIGMMALPAAAGEKINLLEELDSDFESGTKEGGSFYTGMSYVKDTQNAQSGNWYLSVPEVPTEGQVYGLSVGVSVKGSTTYTVSFWARSSMAKSGRILIRNMVNGEKYTTWASESGITASALGTDVETRFGHQPAEGQERSDWYEVKKSFTTAPETNQIFLQIYSKYSSSGSENDLKLCLDNVSLVEGTENLLRNGEMNVNRGGSAPDYWTAYTAKTSDATMYEVVEDPAASGSGNMVYKSGKYYQLYQNVVLPKGQYKLTTRFRGPVAASVAKGGATNGSYISWGGNYSFNGDMGPAITESLVDTWVTYTTYFTAPEDGTYAVGIGGRWESANRYYDDTVLLPAEDNTVEYVTKGTADVAEKKSGNVTHVRGNSVEKISDVGTSDNVHTLTAIGHYVAKNMEETEKFTLVSAVYRKNKTTNEITLHNIVIQDGESAKVTGYKDGLPEHNSENIMADISVPVADDTYTYEVKSFLWSSASGMKPVGEVFTLTY